MTREGKQRRGADELPEAEELATDALAELQSAGKELNATLALLENGNGQAEARQTRARK